MTGVKGVALALGATEMGARAGEQRRLGGGGGGRGDEWLVDA